MYVAENQLHGLCVILRGGGFVCRLSVSLGLPAHTAVLTASCALGGVEAVLVVSSDVLCLSLARMA